MKVRTLEEWREYVDKTYPEETSEDFKRAVTAQVDFDALVDLYAILKNERADLLADGKKGTKEWIEKEKAIAFCAEKIANDVAFKNGWRATEVIKYGKYGKLEASL